MMQSMHGIDLPQAVWKDNETMGLDITKVHLGQKVVLDARVRHMFVLVE